jgi:carbamoyltransferase
VDYIAINRNPYANLLRKVVFLLRHPPSLKFLKDRAQNTRSVKNIDTQILKKFANSKLKARIYHVEHHLAHLVSTFMVSPFDEAAVVSVDGFGDFVGSMWGVGQGNRLKDRGRIFFPDSLGLFYLAMTQFLGFPKYGDEYKVMGLAAYGEPTELARMQRLVRLGPKGRFQLNLDYFLHQFEGAPMSWDGVEPHIGPVFSPQLEELLGPARVPGEAITRRHENLAASLQASYEGAFFHILNFVYEQVQTPNVCLAGGCAMNSVANGKIFRRTPFKEVYIQPAAGDAGGAIGAAFYVWNQLLGQPRDFVMETSYWGPQFTESEVTEAIGQKKGELSQLAHEMERIEDGRELCKKAAAKIAAGNVVGWFQGRMEWGPRALGNRSIVVDPRRSEMKEILNARIKRREPFRPFAPSILMEAVDDYFLINYPDPFMIKVYPIRPEKRHLIPAVTHVDGTGRLQTVRREDNPLYWQLIKEFENLTGIPLVLNTSFNENEPIVCAPAEALDCFLRTKMDVLFLGPYMIARR